MEIVVLFGSPRADGNTMKALRAFLNGRQPQLVHLPAAELAPYRYQGPTPDDDLPRIVAAMVDSDVIVFATPVFWYSMSAPMKTFFDRLTDLLDERRTAGRALVGRPCCLVATGSDPRLPTGFEEVFRRTAAYLDMRWIGACYAAFDRDGRMSGVTPAELRRHGARILAAASE